MSGMKSYRLLFLAKIAILGLMFLNSCSKDDTKPLVETSAVVSIESTSAISGGIIKDDNIVKCDKLVLLDLDNQMLFEP